MSGRWVKVDVSWLPPGSEQRPDLVIELYDDGQLRRLARMRGEACICELQLAHAQARGRQTDHEGSGGSADWTTYQDGCSESFDAWSDNSRPRPEPFADFVRRSIQRVAGKAK